MVVSPPIKARKIILPYDDLAMEGQSNDWLTIPNDIALTLSLGTMLGPNGAKVNRSDSNGNLYISGGPNSAALAHPPALPLLQFIEVLTATTNDAWIPTNGALYLTMFTWATAVSGTTPSLTVNIVGSFDATNTTAFTIVTSSAITTVGGSFSPNVGPGLTTAKMLPPFIRLTWQVTGTTPSFTMNTSLALSS